jgi:antitoxin component of MazEF toxin-antitoxin module
MMSILTQKTDPKGRLQLPSDFADCLVAVERNGDELRIRKVRQVTTRRYSFKQLMVGVTPQNIHAEIQTDPAAGGEAL